jgi:hypothetical protein
MVTRRPPEPGDKSFRVSMQKIEIAKIQVGFAGK